LGLQLGFYILHLLRFYQGFYLLHLLRFYQAYCNLIMHYYHVTGGG